MTMETLQVRKGGLFWTKVDVAGPDDCWLWTAGRYITGYGRFRGLKASRIALQEHLGRKLDRTEFACHRCDNPPCVNPAHLFVGSVRDNAADMVAKGRAHRWNGARAGAGNPRARLTEEQVREIRRLRGTMPVKDIAATFGVCYTSVGDILHGKTWGSLP